MDADGDRIVEGDACPDEPEVYNGTDDEDGCPDRPPREACMWNDYLRILVRVYFEQGSSQIATASDPIVAALAETLQHNPHITLVAVVGGTDAAEDPGVAEARALAVREALVAAGVDAARLEAHGRGAQHARGEPESDRAVWFVIWAVAETDPLPRSYDVPGTDCAEDLRAWREEGHLRDCDCVARERREAAGGQ